MRLTSHKQDKRKYNKNYLKLSFSQPIHICVMSNSLRRENNNTHEDYQAK
uniref:Uncharacterized protein n=1 Tax=Rhizophora mucronata TaxID=61149 RepID=A0A2P2P765_RHIMU